MMVSYSGYWAAMTFPLHAGYRGHDQNSSPVTLLRRMICFSQQFGPGHGGGALGRRVRSTAVGAGAWTGCGCLTGGVGLRDERLDELVLLRRCRSRDRGLRLISVSLTLSRGEDIGHRTGVGAHDRVRLMLHISRSPKMPLSTFHPLMSSAGAGADAALFIQTVRPNTNRKQRITARSAARDGQDFQLPPAPVCEAGAGQRTDISAHREQTLFWLQAAGRVLSPLSTTP